MGPNRQRKPKPPPKRGGRGGHGRMAAAPANGAVPQRGMLSKEHVDMIIDVLHHAASGGSVPVPEKHFDGSAGGKITFHRNARLSPAEIAQRVLEGLGFPPDLTEHFVEEWRSAGLVPPVSSADELLESGGEHQAFLVQCCLDLFAGMVSFHRESGNGDQTVDGDEGSLEGGTETDAEPDNEEDETDILLEEIETIEMMYPDNFVAKRNFEDGDSGEREMHFVFTTLDDKNVLAIIRIPDDYPADPPLVFLQMNDNSSNRRQCGGTQSASSQTTASLSSAALPTVTKNATKEFAAASRRVVLDAAAETIATFTDANSGCLISLVGGLHSALASVTACPTETVPEEGVQLARASESKPAGSKGTASQAEQRTAFMAALTKQHKNEQTTDGSGPSEKRDGSAAGTARKDQHPAGASGDKKPSASSPPTTTTTTTATVAKGAAEDGQDNIAQEVYTSSRPSWSRTLENTRSAQQRQKGDKQRETHVNPTEGDHETDGFFNFSMPEKVELSMVDSRQTSDNVRRTEFVRKDAQLNSKLKVEWEELSRRGQLQQLRRQLPAYKAREDLRRALEHHNVVVVGGDTGSGKTTQIPQYLYEFLCEEGRGGEANIVCTQPRRLAATAVALRVAEERDEAVGGTVGYSIRLENCVSSRTQILYCTTGITLRRLQTDKFLGRVSHVVVDEIHERGVDTDFLLILLKDLLTRRSDLKVILMSATMDSDLFSRYFGGAPVISIVGRTFPVTVHHLEDIIPLVQYAAEEGSPYCKRVGDSGAVVRRNTRNFNLETEVAEAEDELQEFREIGDLAKVLPNASSSTLATIARLNLDVLNYELIHAIVWHITFQMKENGAILIFLPGMAEIHRCSEYLKYDPELAKKCVIFNLHSSLGSGEQKEVFRAPPAGKRKVVIGTNIMETSITIDDAVFVIDCGKSKENRYNAQKSLSQLVTTNISKANCRQRQGRAGRVRPGHCFRLFTSAQFDRFADHQLCEMHRVPLESLVLQIYTLNLGDEMEYLSKALSPPEERAVQSSVRVLTTLGALTAEKRLTSLGWHLANLPIDVRIGKMIIHGALLRCVDPVLTIAACVSVRSPFVSAIDVQAEVQSVRRALSGETMSDHIAVWAAYQHWCSALHKGGPAAARKVCGKYYLSQGTLTQIQSTKQQYEKYLCESGFIDSTTKRSTSSHRFLFPPYCTLDDRVFESGGAEFNAESANSKCIVSCLVAGLYPNVARVARSVNSRAGPPKLRIHTFDGSEAMLHPSAVASKQSQLSYPLLVYVDKVKTSTTFLREVSMVDPLQVILFGGGSLEYLEAYQELCISDAYAVKCTQEEATLLVHLKDQLDSALRAKINDPTVTWESVSSVVVRAIIRMLRSGTSDGGSSKHMVVVDRRARREPLTAPLLGVNSATGTDSQRAAPPPPPPEQLFVTKKSCFVCGGVGHLSRYCPQAKERKKGGPSNRCFVCGMWHHPVECPLSQPTQGAAENEW